MNSYRRPPEDDDNIPNKDDDPKPEKPTTEITDDDIPKDSGILDILDEMIPLGTLPQTGTL